MSQMTVQEISQEQTWCTELRRILRLKKKTFSLGTSDDKKLQEADAYAREQLKKLASLDQAKFKILGAKYKSLANQAAKLKQGSEEAILVVIEELNVLGKQIEYQIALVEAEGVPQGHKDRKKAVEKVTKAREGYEKSSGTLNGKFQTLLGQAGRYLSEIGAQPYADKSRSFDSLSKLHTKWNDAYGEVKGKRDEMFDFANALSELKVASELASKARSEVKIDQEEYTRQAEYKGRYESKVERLKLVRANIFGRVGSENDVLLIDVALKAGETALKPHKTAHVQEPKYFSAFEAIRKHVEKTEKLEKQALKHEKEILSSLAKDPQISQKQQLAQTALAKLFVSGSELITKSEHLNFQKEINSALTQCVKDKVKGLGRLDTFIQAFGGIETERSEDRSECNRLSALVKQALETLSYKPSEDERELLNDWSGRLRLAEADIGNCDFASAREVLEALHEETADAVSTCTTKKSDFEAIWNDNAHKKLRSDAEKKAREAAQANNQRVEDTYYAKMLARANKRAESGDFPGAIELLESLDFNIQRDSKNKTFTASNEFKDADKQVQEQIKKTRGALQLLVTALEQAGDTKGTAWKEQTERVNEIEHRWNENKGAATDLADLRAENYIGELVALAEEFARLAGSPRKIKGAMIKAQYNLDLKAFDAATKEVNAALDELATRDRGPRYETLLKERIQIEDGAPDKTGGFTKSIESMNLLKGKITALSQAAAREHATALQKFNTKATEVRTEINDLLKAAKSSLKPMNSKFFQPFFDELESDHAALSDISKSPSLAMLSQGSLELDRMLKRIELIRSDMDGNVGSLKELVNNALGKNDAPEVEEEEEDPEAINIAWLFEEEGEDERGQPKLSETVKPNFRLVVAGLADLGEQLKNANLGECLPTRKRLLEEDYKGLSSDVKSLPPADGLKALYLFQKRVTEAIGLADGAKAKRNEFNNTHKPAVKRAFKALTGYEPEAKLGKLFKEEKAYYGELAKEYLAAKGLIETENKETEALTKIKELKTKLDKATNTPGDLETNEKEAQLRKLQAEKDKAQWEMYVDEFERLTLPRVSKALEVDGADKTQYTDCQNLLKRAKDNYKSTQNATAAIAMLQLARDRAEVAIQFPLGTAATSRNQLPKSAARWKKAVAAFGASIDKVIDAMESAVSEEGYSVKDQDVTDEEDFGIRDLFAEEGDIEQAAKQSALVLKSLKRLFDPNVFDKTVAVMSGKKVEPRAARAAREEGLREVRRYFDMLYNDPILVKLMQNPRPFGIVEESTLYTALRDLDLNLQRSV